MLALDPLTGPPLAMWLDGAFALMVTEPLRAWLLVAPLRAAMAGEPEAAGATGTAGVMLGRPFTGEADAGFPFWGGMAGGAAVPTTRGALAPVAVKGVGVGFFDAPA